ncbi:MAG: hypothetical protein ACK421_09050 [Pseudanabaenaceae cyanobacterium]
MFAPGMYWESVLLLASMAIVVPYTCFALVSSLIDEEAERRYSTKAKSTSTTLVVPQAKVARPEVKKGMAAIVKVAKQDKKTN